MGYKKGIDVSEHNGQIDWEKVRASGVDFAMLRAGYGQKAADRQFQRNISACNQLGIPCGVYWFSYALDSAGAAREARCCLETIRPWKVAYPVAFDLEYDSVNYAKRHGVVIGKALATAMAKAFLGEIRGGGHTASIYTNRDFLNRYFDASALAGFPLWLAQWVPGTPAFDKPPMPCAIWQYSSGGHIPGVPNHVDLDVCYAAYPAR